MAKGKTKTKADGKGPRGKKLPPWCPMVQASCIGPRCAWFHSAKKAQYSRCGVAELAQGVNNLGFRVGEIADGGGGDGGGAVDWGTTDE